MADSAATHSLRRRLISPTFFIGELFFFESARRFLGVGYIISATFFGECKQAVTDIHVQTIVRRWARS